MRQAVNQRLNKSLFFNMALGSSALALLSGLAQPLTGLGIDFTAVSLGLFAAASLPLLALAVRHLETQRFGAANAVTLIRMALTAMLCALLFAPGGVASQWLCIAVATSALLLDGVDGMLARRLGTSSRFGARFDMEVDAALILVLALLAWHFERAGGWVLIAGLLRYFFVAAAVVFPWMRAELPSSMRRKTICVVQSVTLLICIGPIVAERLAYWVAASGVLLLVWSFAVDLVWLFKKRRSGVRQ